MAFDTDSSPGPWPAWSSIAASRLATVRSLSLARFRDLDRRDGGVDLLVVRQELESAADDLLVHQLDRGLFLGTVLVFVGLPAQILAVVSVALVVVSRYG